MAHAMQADFLEQDVVLTKDDVPIVLHDIFLDAVTNVASVFPERRRENGRYYALDFTLDEIKRLRVTERIDLRTGAAVFPNRFPAWSGDFRVSTLAEELELIAGLNRSTGRIAGVYTEVKLPAWHREQGRDPSRLVIEELATAGYRGSAAPAFVQCFDFEELRRMRDELGCDLPLVQLIGSNASPDARGDFDLMCQESGLREIAGVAAGIGPSLDRVLQRVPAGHGSRIAPTELTRLAHTHGLVVHAFTLRADTLPPGIAEIDQLHEALFSDARIDGVFTDFPDRTRDWLRSRGM
jgi:glycerophosphoryl diester phosphodiesterase